MGPNTQGPRSARRPDWMRALDEFESGGTPERRRLRSRACELLPRPGSQEATRGQYFEAVLRAPQKAKALDGLLADYERLGRELRTVDVADHGEVSLVVDELRALARRESALFAEIWYLEIGGEG